MLNAKRAAVIWVNVFSCGLGSFLIRAGCALDKSVALWSLAAALKPLGLRPSLEEIVCPQSYFLHVSFSLWMLLAVSHALFLSCYLVPLLSPRNLLGVCSQWGCDCYFIICVIALEEQRRLRLPSSLEDLYRLRLLEEWICVGRLVNSDLTK